MENLNSGFCKETKTFHSLRSPVDLPSPEEFPLSVADFAFSLLSSWPWYTSSTAYLIDSATGNRLSYSEFIQRVKNLAGSLKSRIPLSKGDAAFVLLPNSTYVPILYFSLLSLGLIVCPSNPAADESETQRQMQIGKPVIAFTTFENRHKTSGLKYGTISIDSSEFESMMECHTHNEIAKVDVSQNDIAAIIFSSGTTGLVKGVELTHKNLISVIRIYHDLRRGREFPAVQLLTTPLFHIYGFFYSLRAVALCETAVIWTSSVFDEKEFLKAVEEFRVTHAAATPPLLGAMVMGDVTDGYDTTSLESVACGGAPLKKSVIESFGKKFPGALIRQGYGLTESSGAAFRSLCEEECRNWGSVGRLLPNFEAKIAGLGSEFESGLPPMKKGELWIRGPTIMRGYVDDLEASSRALSDDGWLRTGDFCYIDEEGFLFVVDRIKELIQCDGYQVSPAEIEQILHSHSLIADAAVIGNGDEEKSAVAFVVVKDKNILSEVEVMDFIKEKLHDHQIIRKVTFVSFIPKSPAGKILRKDLKASFLI
ncbi:4-coumarate--CoA ligase-like 9 [Impatiens glandulifera]|uniref:4-coumarate--CoA ligase-like 9 n=1 Tax=Impatiens glandulifera TaxID=253017 RepID=UPI001FB17CE5|nr:4-coumarate--CoA ligase-like 9 [Impatiens glandulifera]